MKSKPRRRNLTVRFLDSLRTQNLPAYKGVNYWDTYLPRFGVRVLGRADQKLNRISYQVMARVSQPAGDTVPKRQTLGQYPVLPLKEARERARAILQIVDDGEDPFVKTRIDRPDTVADLFERFCKERIEPKHKNPHWNRKRYEHCIIPHFGHLALANLTRAGIKAALTKVEQTSGEPARLDVHRSLRSMLNWALEEEIIDRSPLIGIKPPKARKRTRTLTEGEIPIFWRAASSFASRHGAIVKFLLVTGQRRGTVAGMRWANIDGKTWTIPGELMKGPKDQPKPHAVPLSPLALQIIDAMPKGSPLVFATSLNKHSPIYGRPYSGWGRSKRRLDQRIVRLLGEGEFPPWVLHDLRRTQKTMMSKLGIDRTVSEMLQGRQPISGAESHYDLYDRWPERVAAMDIWDQYLQTLLGRSGAP